MWSIKVLMRKLLVWFPWGQCKINVCPVSVGRWAKHHMDGLFGHVGLLNQHPPVQGCFDIKRKIVPTTADIKQTIRHPMLWPRWPISRGELFSCFVIASNNYISLAAEQQMCYKYMWSCASFHQEAVSISVLVAWKTTCKCTSSINNAYMFIVSLLRIQHIS